MTKSYLKVLTNKIYIQLISPYTHTRTQAHAGMRTHTRAHTYLFICCSSSGYQHNVEASESCYWDKEQTCNTHHCHTVYSVKDL